MAPRSLDTAQQGLPRPLLLVGASVAGVLLTALFIYLGFPYDRLGEFIAAGAGRAAGVHLVIREVGPSLHLAGPGLEVTGVRATWASEESLPIDRAMVRPAWSLSWLAGRPALYVEVEAPSGALEGTVTLSGTRAWNGELRDVDLARLPVARLLPGAALEGRVDASVDLRGEESGPEGTVTFEARKGSLSLPGLPVATAFDQLAGDLVFGGDAYIEVKSLRLEGPLLSADAKGTVGRAPSLGQAPLDLDVKISAQSAARIALEALGVRVGRDNSSRIRISGTPSQPVVRESSGGAGPRRAGRG